jgi:DNA polymerase I
MIIQERFCMKKDNSSEKTLVLLDAHAILHRAYHALPDFLSPKGEPTGALYGVVSMVLKIVEELHPDYIVACFDLPDPTYRHTAFAGYKGSRSKTDDELVTQINRSRDIFDAFGIPVLSVPGFEADDILGTIAHQTKDIKGLTTIIASGDMDTLQCVCKKKVLVYTLKKGIKDTILYDEKAVVDRFGFLPKLIPDFKGLRGDASDNIPGIVGIGEKTATTLISRFGSLESIYKMLKKNEEVFYNLKLSPRIVSLVKDGEEEAMFSKMLATIRIDAPIKYEIPNQIWREVACLQINKIKALFAELGFKSLQSRLERALSVDTNMEAEKVNQEIEPHKLKEAQIWLWLLESDRTNATSDQIIDYGRAYFDAEDFATIHMRLNEKIMKEEILWNVYTKIEKPLIGVIGRINANGVLVDLNYLKNLSNLMHKELIQLESMIYNLAGKEFNINSPKQLGDILFDTIGLKPKNQKKTASGQRSTKESELEKLTGEHPIINEILRYRTVQKLVSTYVDSLPSYVGNDGRLRTTFLQTGTTTGRLASKDPNMQNIPIRTDEGKSIRRAFIAPEGYTLVSIDYSQIELRIAAILSGDKNLIDIFRRGEDVHTGVAMRVFGVSLSEVTDEMRRKAKIINFGILYGMGVNALRQNLGDTTSREEAQAFLTAYFQTFSRLADYLEETKAHARKYGYTETFFGRRRLFQGINSNAPFIRAQAERMAINAPIQGTQADVIRIAMIHIDTFISKNMYLDDVKVLLQVHDELLLEIRDDKLSDVIPLIDNLMKDVLSLEQSCGVPILTDIAVGKNWADMSNWIKE